MSPHISEIPGLSMPTPHQSGRIFLILIGLATALIGAAFVWLLASSYLRARAMRDWPTAPCTILVSAIEERQHDPFSKIEYRHRILYGYEFSGERLTSDQFSLRGSRWTSRREEIADQVSKLPVGNKTTCLISPTPPHHAVLKPDSLAPGYTLWFPLLFVVGGIGIMIRALRSILSHQPKSQYRTRF